jgi:succinate dehydrogenase / fumarate reductase iron-sulfur subunit
MESVPPRFSGPRRSRRACASSGDSRDAATVERLADYSGEHGIWECTRCYFCNERCPKGVDPRDAIAKLGAEAVKQGVDPDMGVKHAKWFVTSAKTTGWLRETSSCRRRRGSSRDSADGFALARARQGASALPPHVATG